LIGSVAATAITLKVIEIQAFEDTHSVSLNVEIQTPQLYVAAPFFNSKLNGEKQ
jgi:hypothetical protein